MMSIFKDLGNNLLKKVFSAARIMEDYDGMYNICSFLRVWGVSRGGA